MRREWNAQSVSTSSRTSSRDASSRDSAPPHTAQRASSYETLMRAAGCGTGMRMRARARQEAGHGRRRHVRPLPRRTGVRQYHCTASSIMLPPRRPSLDIAALLAEGIRYERGGVGARALDCFAQVTDRWRDDPAAAAEAWWRLANQHRLQSRWLDALDAARARRGAGPRARAAEPRGRRAQHRRGDLDDARRLCRRAAPLPAHARARAHRQHAREGAPEPRRDRRRGARLRGGRAALPGVARGVRVGRRRARRGGLHAQPRPPPAGARRPRRRPRDPRGGGGGGARLVRPRDARRRDAQPRHGAGRAPAGSPRRRSASPPPTGSSPSPTSRCSACAA